jgi:hypothetical protein
LSSIANFAQSFPLNRNRLKLTVEAIAQNPRSTPAEIAAYGGFNHPVAEGFVGWAKHTGLIRGKDRNNELTAIGKLIQEHDRFLIDPNTLWLLHYFLCVEHEERSEAWYLFANQYAVAGLQTSKEQFRNFYEMSATNKGVSKSAFDKDAGLLFNCYTSTDALGTLGIIHPTDSKNRYEIWKPALPAIHIRAFALFDFWSRQQYGTNTISLDELAVSPCSIGKVFFMTLEEMRTTINELASMGLVTFSDTQHRPVNRIYQNQPYDLIEKYYKSL